MEEFEALETVGIIIMFVLFIIAIALILTFPIMWLWNWLMPMIFGLMKLTFWQTLGVALLSGMLFGSKNIKSKD